VEAAAVGTTRSAEKKFGLKKTKKISVEMLAVKVAALHRRVWLAKFGLFAWNTLEH
jgi:hypothetical protein